MPPDELLNLLFVVVRVLRLLGYTYLFFKIRRHRFVAEPDRIKIVRLPLLNQRFDVCSHLACDWYNFFAIPKIDTVIEYCNSFTSGERLKPTSGFVANDGANVVLVAVLAL